MVCACRVIFPPAPDPDAVLNRPVPGSEIVAEFAAVTVKSPPCPPPLELLSTLAPLVWLKLVTVKATLPAFPEPEVATDMAPPLFIVSVGVTRFICPALPALDAVLKSPPPIPAIVTASVAVTPSVPPPPAPAVLLVTCEPPVRLKLFTFSEALPALPAPEVATEIIPPSAMVNIGVVKLIAPALPVLDAALNNPLLLPEIEVEFAAVTITLPP